MSTQCVQTNLRQVSVTQGHDIVSCFETTVCIHSWPPYVRKFQFIIHIGHKSVSCRHFTAEVKVLHFSCNDTISRFIGVIYEYCGFSLYFFVMIEYSWQIKLLIKSFVCS